MTTPDKLTTQLSPAKRDRDLLSWWKRFQSRTKRDDEKREALDPRRGRCQADRATAAAPTGIFAVPLSESIKYANVAISLTDAEGKSFIYGYVPIVVAKCGVFLKEKGRRRVSTDETAH